MPYFEVLQDGFAKKPCDADLVFCSWVLDLRTKAFEKTEGDLQKEKRPVNLIIFNFTNIGNVWASKEAKLIIRIAFFCSKFMRCLELDSDPMQYKDMKDRNEK